MAEEKKNVEPIQFERNHYLITPHDPAQREFCELVEKSTRNTLLTDYKMRLNAGYTTTFACVYLESMIQVLGKALEALKEDTYINFLDLFTVSANNREAEISDKDGNINVVFTPGPIVTTIMERDYAPVVFHQDWKDTIINKVERAAATTLSTKHKAVVDNLFRLTYIAYVYFQYLFRTIKLRAREAHEHGMSSVSINFLELMEVHCTMEEITNPDNPELVRENFKISIRPGFEAKLLIKNDDVTEQMD